MSLNRTVIAVCVAAVLVAGCKKQEQTAAAQDSAASAETSAPGAVPEPATAEPPAAEPAQPQPAAAKAFDLNAIAVSDKPLGEWPYLAAPAGYTFSDDAAKGTKDLARVPFWTGDQLVWVEGKTYETQLHAGEGKTYSRFEVLKGVDQALTALGAVKLTDKAIDQATYDASKAEIDPFVQEFADIYNAYYPQSSGSQATYVIRRGDKAIWATVTSTNEGAGMLVAEGPLPEAQAGAQ